MSCEQSRIGASVRAAMTPFIAATYGARVPKSVTRAMRLIVGRSPFAVGRRRLGQRPTANCQLPTANYTSAVFATIRPPGQRLLVFARLPELGKVKTRLGESIGAERALAVYEAMLRDLLRSIGGSNEETEIEVLWAPTAAATGEALRRAFGNHPLAMQTGANLGDRLAMAFSERFFFHRAQKVIAIGVDDPRLSREMIDDAFALL